MRERSTAKRARASGSNSPNARVCPSRHASRTADLTTTHTNSALGRVHCVDRAKPVTRITRRQFAVNFNEGVARSRRSLRAPDQALESKDEGIHLWRT